MREQWFQHFKSGDFDVVNKEHGKSQKKILRAVKPGGTVDTKCYQHQLTKLNGLLLEIKTRIPKEPRQSHFSS